MKKKLNWRLGKLPTSDEVRELVKDKIITQDEAREILFNQETEEDRDKKSLESEIKFLRELVEKLSNNPTRIIETIKEIKVPYYQYNWYHPYEVWCSSGTSLLNTNSTGGTMYLSTTNTTSADASLAGSSSITNLGATNFSDISTF